MSLRFFFLAICLSLSPLLFAQEAKPLMDKTSALFQLNPVPMPPLEPGAFLIPDPNAESWNFSLTNIRGIYHAGSDEKAAIKALKAEKNLQKALDAPPLIAQGFDNPEGAAPIKLRNFEGNPYNNWFPPDNTLAIANNGFMVSIVNSNIRFLNQNGTLLSNQTLGAFFSNLGLTDFFYDPRVIYDSDQDKFIMVALHSNTPADSKIVVCFSQSNDPTQGWWIYTFNGNFLVNNTWFDFPSIGVSGKDLFVSGNLFNANNTFNQAVVMQFQKEPGFAGGSLSWNYFNNVTNGLGSSAFTVAPVSFGFQGSYGPGIYLVSTSPGGGNHAHLYDITADLGDNPQIFAFQIPTASYSSPGNAEQPSSSKLLDVGDCRVTSAFFADGVIHYAHLIDFGGGYAGFRYNRMDVGTNSVSFTNYGQHLFDHAYPAITPIGAGPGSKSVLAAFLRSSKSNFPECRVVSFDENMSPSSSTLIKAGESFINVNSDNIQRWGDYSGISRKHNATPPIAWMSGCYGKNNNTYGTWIAEISLTPETSTADVPSPGASRVFPNPVSDVFTLEWEMPEASNLNIFVVGSHGNIIRTLFRGRAKAGLNRMTFNKEPLGEGVYFLIIQDENNQTLQSEKIVVIH